MLRLGLKHFTTEGSNQHRLRPILHLIYTVHGQRLYPETIRRPFHCLYSRPANKRYIHFRIGPLRNRVVFDAAKTFIKEKNLIRILSFLILLST